MIPYFARAAETRFLSTLEGLRNGRLTLTTPQGHQHHFGDSGPEVDLQIKDWALLPALMARGDVGLGEAFIDGIWTSSSVEGVVALGLQNIDLLDDYAEPKGLNKWRYWLIDRVLRMNTRGGSSRNIRAHYDVGNAFYQLWLDPGMTYSSAIFAAGDDDLGRAQNRKIDRVLSRLTGGERILEIGCGWGSLAERAAATGRHVTGLTLSPSQKGYADARLDGRADIRLQDYRATTGTFDNIVSIEMIEAVGERYWPTYFGTLKARLAEGGRAVVQAITVPDAEFSLYRKRSDFIRQHSFPGGMLPCDAMMAHHASNAGLRVQESFAFGADYARTCRIWAERMLAQSPRIRRLGHDDRFLRSWQFYLESCAATFATGRADVVQVQYSHAA